MAGASLCITAFNLFTTSTTFNLEVGKLEVPRRSWEWNTSQTFMSTLPPGGNQNYMAVQDHFGWLGQPRADMFAIWDDGVSRFGVKLHTPVELLGYGTSPYYLYMQDTNINGGYESVDWKKPPTPATSVELTLQSGLIVLLSPNAGSSGITVNINISPSSAS